MLSASNISLISTAAPEARNSLVGTFYPAGLKLDFRPFNPEKVLRDIQKPPAEDCRVQTDIRSSNFYPTTDELPITPVTHENLALLRSEVEDDIHRLDNGCKLRLQMVLNATENAFVRNVRFFYNRTGICSGKIMKEKCDNW
ncbi:hypothetical protein BGW36DRAFT_139384 [Talaromyces proteolyticus]|uniref:Uncharacterized protein n=1 Tax=Talaromyces proteolyticus TaxID=1131652 RepID=A0AAD4L169_9EURO|nr:uncharacterized protein BGW36DRAFT_139384 [Talaromyces proteolyticus]KAH8701009.1 hypothetical protein BGW36DRAFT_139384 [Talaromyces proteolyticus]